MHVRNVIIEIAIYQSIYRFGVRMYSYVRVLLQF